MRLYNLAVCFPFRVSHLLANFFSLRTASVHVARPVRQNGRRPAIENPSWRLLLSERLMTNQNNPTD